jgi:hypothetical protein
MFGELALQRKERVVSDPGLEEMIHSMGPRELASFLLMRF